MSCGEIVKLLLDIDKDGTCHLQLLTQPENETQREPETSQRQADVPSLVRCLMAACHPDDMVSALKEAWTPAGHQGDMGTFVRLSDGELLLNTVPLSQKLLSCMTSPSIDLDAAFALADLLAVLCLGSESTLLLQPIEVLTSVRRLIKAKRRETREGALRCMTNLIKGNEEYCQSFMECNVMDFILDQIDYENEVEVADYACKSVLSLVHFVTKDDGKLESLLTRALPALFNMLKDENEISTKLNALHCLEDIRDIDIVASKLKEDEIVKKLAPLLKTQDPDIKQLAIELFGKNVNERNSEDLRSLPPDVAFALLREIFERSTEELECVRLRLLECVLSAVHSKAFAVNTPEAQFFSQVILKDTKACASKAIDILVVAWDMHEGMAGDLAKSDGFLSQLPHAMSMTQAALHIMDSMFKADLVTSHAMAENLGISELQSLRKEMKEGTTEVTMIVLDMFMKLIEQEQRGRDLIKAGILEDLVEFFDCESVTIRRRCWRMCASILSRSPAEATRECIELGIVHKYEILFVDFLDQQKEAADPIEHTSELDDLFAILKSISELKPGARAICDAGILSRLLEFVTPNGIICEEIRDVVMNVLTALPVTTSRLLAQKCGFDVLMELVKSRNVQLKRLGFEMLKLISFKECSSYLSDSGLIAQLCQFLHDPNPRLKKDTVIVLCKMSRFALKEVCSQIADVNCASSLWTASRAIQGECDESKALWKIFQGLRSIEATNKAERKKLETRVASRRSSCSFSTQDNRELLDELNKMRRGYSFSASQRYSFSSKARLSVGSQPAPKPSKASVVPKVFRRGRKKSRDSDLAIQKEAGSDAQLSTGRDSMDASLAPPPLPSAPSGRFQRFRSFPGFRRGRNAQG